ncbi:S9 family peptidase [Sciscionella marina]|uniref:S9 family peptidase n=1 Tax=Sciscionella marina TaxID=508770 RepID=UPI0003A29402|nr:prolyl oligopeptidase family serine peptidase [Sciscionella marina]
MQARTQRFTLGTPRMFQISPDGSRVLFLRSASGTDPVHRLHSFDVASDTETCLLDPAALGGAEEEPPAEERARRERSRTQGAGIQGYSCDAEHRIAVAALSGRCYVVELREDRVRELPTAQAIVDPRPSPDGAHVAYVSEGTLRVIGSDGTGDRELAGEDGVSWGLAEFVAAEEMGRSRGYWWSPDGQWLLAARVDATALPQWTIADAANPQSPARTVGYPAAGTVNAEVSLTLISLDGQRIPVEWDRQTHEYLAAVHWSEHGAPLLAVQSRDQRSLQFRTVDIGTGRTELHYEQTEPVWVDLVDGVPAWTASGELVTVRAANGAYRLFLDDRAVTPDGMQVRSVLDVGKDVLCTASMGDPTRIHVYRVDADTVQQLSTVEGVNGGTRRGDAFVLTSLGLDEAGVRATVHSGSRALELESLAIAPPLKPQPELLELGERGLRAALLLPSDHVPGTKLPVLLDPYGGPHAQRVLAVANAFTTPQWIADQGFAVLIADGRGTPGRGPEWERAIHHELAEVTLADQVDALHAAAGHCADLDLGRVAIRGWSYGGYLSALAVLRRPDVFHAAVVGAPVTEWELYDTHYTERYLGTPEENPQVYHRNSVTGEASGLRSEMLIIHGLADDNVFAAHGLRLSAALLKAGRRHAMIPMPGVTHMSPTDEESAEHFLLFQLDWIKRALEVR